MTPQQQPNNAIRELLEYERFREIIEYLCRHKDELLDAPKVKIIFNCAGPKVQPSRIIHGD